jgi:hypothetical protein
MELLQVRNMAMRILHRTQAGPIILVFKYHVATWPGPFGFVLANNTTPATYASKQFMEFR